MKKKHVFLIAGIGLLLGGTLMITGMNPFKNAFSSADGEEDCGCGGPKDDCGCHEKGPGDIGMEELEAQNLVQSYDTEWDRAINSVKATTWKV